jgi:hypothetical protein
MVCLTAACQPSLFSWTLCRSIHLEGEGDSSGDDGEVGEAEKAAHGALVFSQEQWCRWRGAEILVSSREGVWEVCCFLPNKPVLAKIVRR